MPRTLGGNLWSLPCDPPPLSLSLSLFLSVCLSLSLSLSNASFLPTYRHQIRDIRTSNYALTSVRQLTHAARGHAARCVTVYLYLHSTEYLNTAIHAYVRVTHTHTHTHTKRFLCVSTLTFPFYLYTNMRYRTARPCTDGLMHPRALITLASS